MDVGDIFREGESPVHGGQSHLGGPQVNVSRDNSAGRNDAQANGMRTRALEELNERPEIEAVESLAVDRNQFIAGTQPRAPGGRTLGGLQNYNLALGDVQDRAEAQCLAPRLLLEHFELVSVEE